jgi:predicted transcriptional regulator
MCYDYPMDQQLLITAGLQPQQAELYAILLEQGKLTPPAAAAATGLSRSNAYKALDRLVELSLATKADFKKKLTYSPSNPLALATMVGEARNKITAQEEAVKVVMNQLLTQYYQKTEQPGVETVTGKTAVTAAFRQQTNLKQPVYFVRTKADIPVMSFDLMDDIRLGPSRVGQQRYGITPDVSHGPTNPTADVRSNLTRTWVKHEDYSAPVEWSVSGSMLLIVLYASEPHAIVIMNPLIAEAFRQLWSIMDVSLRAMDSYKSLPRTKD